MEKINRTRFVSSKRANSPGEHTEANHILGHETDLKRVKIKTVTPSTCNDHAGILLEGSNITGNFPSINT